MYFTPQQNIEATLTFEKKKSMYVTKWYKRSSRYLPQHCVEFQGRPPEQEKEEKFQILNSIMLYRRGVYCFTSGRPRYFSSHFSQQLLMAEI
jgi:hypothetical protein